MNEDKRLPDSELEVMLELWRHDDAVRTSDILASLDNGWALATLKVLLGRLVERGCIECLRDGRLMSYKAIITEQSYCKRETDGLLRKYFKGSAKSLVAALAMDDTLTQKDLSEISDMLKAKEGE
ncbi:MAG: BlaI/MecI/CopY family transcriptional regulator [Oscillospiraceae bacterium]